MLRNTTAINLLIFCLGSFNCILLSCSSKDKSPSIDSKYNTWLKGNVPLVYGGDSNSFSNLFNVNKPTEILLYKNGFLKKIKTFNFQDSDYLEILYWPNGRLRDYKFVLLDSVFYRTTYKKNGEIESTSGNWALLMNSGKYLDSCNYRVNFLFLPRLNFNRVVTIRDSKDKFLTSFMNLAEDRIEFDTTFELFKSIPDTLKIEFTQMSAEGDLGYRIFTFTWKDKYEGSGNW